MTIMQGHLTKFTPVSGSVLTLYNGTTLEVIGRPEIDVDASEKLIELPDGTYYDADQNSDANVYPGTISQQIKIAELGESDINTLVATFVSYVGKKGTIEFEPEGFGGLGKQTASCRVKKVQRTGPFDYYVPHTAFITISFRLLEQLS